MEKEPWVMGKSLINLGEEGKGLRVCKFHEPRHFYKRLDVIQRQREPLGGSQQARACSNETCAIAMALR